MANQQDPVKPTPFTTAPEHAGASAAASTPTDNARGRWLVPGFVLLLLLAAAVIFWLPGQVSDTRTSAVTLPATQPPLAEPAAAAAAAPAMPGAPAGAEAGTPYAQGLLAREREAAQAVLEQVLDTQFALEEQGVERWATQDYTRATRLAGEGDELYRQREFGAAGTRYSEALAHLQKIQDRAISEQQMLLDKVRDALESSNIATARENLETAQLIAPDAEQISPLLGRLEVAPEVARLREQAAEAIAEDQLQEAVNALTSALALDAQHLAIAKELQQWQQALLQRNYAGAMSEGYQALAQSRFGAARSAFGRAKTLQPEAIEAANALREVTTEETAYRLAALAEAGETAEAGERWQEAVTHYENAQSLDTSVLFAIEGLSRARPRAKLSAQLLLLLQEPERLTDIKVADAAAKLLEDARSFDAPNRILKKQADQLATLLQHANTPVTVTLISDAATEVVVHKVARLGRFEQHALSLRPGTYTAVGSRRGYRDVRHSFTVEAGSGGADITIRCTEPI